MTPLHLIWSALISLVVVHSKLLEGPNVCEESETYFEKINVLVDEPYIEEELVWCFNIPPKCPKLTTKLQAVTKSENLVRSRIVAKCCDGYAESADGTYCVPLCSQGCIRGTCIAPNTCNCTENYEGSRCDIFIEKSDKEKLNICPAGFHGIKCDLECPPNKYGQNCALNCSCENASGCDHIRGLCTCLPGWTGPHCNIPCPAGKYGQNCSQDCQCNDRGNCRNSDGICECKNGWTGKRCENLCPEGFNGPNCEQSCNCEDEGCFCKNLSDNVRSLMSEEVNESTSITIILILVLILIVIILASVIFISFKLREKRIFGKVFRRNRNSDSENSCSSEKELLKDADKYFQHDPLHLLQHRPNLAEIKEFSNRSKDFRQSSITSYMISTDSGFSSDPSGRGFAPQTIYVTPDTKSIHIYEEIRDPRGYSQIRPSTFGTARNDYSVRLNSTRGIPEQIHWRTAN